MHVVAAATRCCVLWRACAVDCRWGCCAAVVSAALMTQCGGSAMSGSLLCDGVCVVVAQVSCTAVCAVSMSRL